ncbi:MAG: hypothetical protein JOY71_07575 [Acetobacteraceae bacterium]|nr:hypothetical protein [Acetobacteraceae bacterium]MBV8521970.1 hypothetical protein [Acetobacteraceae bacterium]
MKMKWLLGLAALPFLAGVASAAQPLNDAQMDKVTAGFTSLSLADAESLGQIVASQTATLSQVAYTGYTATLGETTLSLYKSLAASQSASTATNTIPHVSLPISGN